MEINNELQKLKSSLFDAIGEWVEKASGDDKEWNELDTCIGDHTKELMADAAFNILLAQKDLTKYLEKEKQLQ